MFRKGSATKASNYQAVRLADRTRGPSSEEVGLCPQCDYNLLGLPGIYRCPECAWHFDEDTVVCRGVPQQLAANPASLVLDGGSLMIALLSALLSTTFEVRTIFFVAAFFFARRLWRYGKTTLLGHCRIIACGPNGVYFREGTTVFIRQYEEIRAVYHMRLYGKHSVVFNLRSDVVGDEPWHDIFHLERRGGDADVAAKIVWAGNRYLERLRSAPITVEVEDMNEVIDASG